MSSDAEILLACIAALAAIIFFVAYAKLPLWAPCYVAITRFTDANDLLSLANADSLSANDMLRHLLSE